MQEFKKARRAGRETNLKTKVKKYRNESGLTQRDLSALTGISQMQISKLERGETSILHISLNNALNIADALGVDVTNLYEEDERHRAGREGQRKAKTIRLQKVKESKEKKSSV